MQLLATQAVTSGAFPFSLAPVTAAPASVDKASAFGAPAAARGPMALAFPDLLEGLVDEAEDSDTPPPQKKESSRPPSWVTVDQPTAPVLPQFQTDSSRSLPEEAATEKTPRAAEAIPQEPGVACPPETPLSQGPSLTTAESPVLQLNLAETGTRIGATQLGLFPSFDKAPRAAADSAAEHRPSVTAETPEPAVVAETLSDQPPAAQIPGMTEIPVPAESTALPPSELSPEEPWNPIPATTLDALPAKAEKPPIQTNVLPGESAPRGPDRNPPVVANISRTLFAWPKTEAVISSDQTLTAASESDELPMEQPAPTVNASGIPLIAYPSPVATGPMEPSLPTLAADMPAPPVPPVRVPGTPAEPKAAPNESRPVAALKIWQRYSSGGAFAAKTTIPPSEVVSTIFAPANPDPPFIPTAP